MKIVPLLPAAGKILKKIGICNCQGETHMWKNNFLKQAGPKLLSRARTPHMWCMLAASQMTAKRLMRSEVPMILYPDKTRVIHIATNLIDRCILALNLVQNTLPAQS